MTGAGPLAGRTVVVTRGPGKGTDLEGLLRAAGAAVLVAPLIRAERIAGDEQIRAALAEVDVPGGGRGGGPWVVFTSANAVRLVVGAAGDALGGARLAAVGQATAAALRRAGLTVDLVPANAIGEGLVAELAAQVAGTRVLVFGAAGGRDVVVRGLREAGAAVELLVLYRSVPPAGAAERFRACIGARPDAVVFASGSAVRHAADALGGVAPAAVAALCIGPVTAAAAAAAGWEDVVTAAAPTATAMVAALVERFGAGHPVP